MGRATVLAEHVIPKGHCVKELQLEGVRVRFFDDAYANKTPEEIQLVKQRLNQTIWDCWNSLQSKST
ncbi:MAG: hypothetical protein LBT44_09005 [Clostridiales bacterium]|jgi:hypothetical protein|nr:hypothetical protein [Clostridiales bacterium]